MKVLFAVNNDEISEAIIKKYQKDYKEILSYKNVYYFNAIIKELQKDKAYDRVVISEDLEPFANNNYDTIDKFLFERLDNISDEATDEQGNDTNIILICNDRRAKSDDMLVKYFGIGIYSALLGQDRSIEQVCNLIYKPRAKKEAKQYYKIESENVNYQAEDENNVSEAEVQNILAHYKRLGKNEEKYVDSFNNIVSQYTDNQLRIIINYLPMGVKAVLEQRSPKYQELMTFGKTPSRLNTERKNQVSTLKQPEEDKIKIQMLDKTKEKITKPIVIPSGLSKQGVKKLIKEVPKPQPVVSIQPEIKQSTNDYYEDNQDNNNLSDLDEMLNNIDNADEDTNQISDKQEEPIKRGRGRPKKAVPVEIEKNDQPKRGRGRPKKNAIEENGKEENDEDDAVDLFDLDNTKQDSQKDNSEDDDGIDLFGLGNEDNSYKKEEEPKQNNEQEDEDDGIDLFGLTGDNEEDEIKNDDSYENTNTNSNQMVATQYNSQDSNYSSLLSRDKKVIAFVGTTKNGTSFVVNNLGELLASMGISTAVLDLTKNKNAFYIYTNNEERLRKQAEESITKLKSGIADGIRPNKNLGIYTGLPTQNGDYSNSDAILATLVKNYSVVLIDCDFDTPVEYFQKAQEIFLVQSMDVLTIQPLTAFLRNLKAKDILKQEKVKVVINKYQKIRSLNAKTLIGGIAFYNDPAMSYMTELFNKDTVPYCVIPFETQNYVKYLDSLANCSITLNGYTKTLISALKDLANLAYPLINKQTYYPRGDKFKDNFTPNMNDTLNKMKKYQ
jgi:hypothetical protein